MIVVLSAHPASEHAGYAFDDKDKVLGENDDAISTKKTSKSEEEASKADNEEFLAKLQKMCAEKTKAFEDRKMVRANDWTGWSLDSYYCSALILIS